jgi:hypothetical protein
MGTVRTAGWCVVTKGGEVLAMCRTRKAAMRRLKRETRECYVAELWYSDGLLES